MTPDELRKWVQKDRMGTHWVGCEKSHKDCAILVAADAWEAREAQWRRLMEIARKHHGRQWDTIDALRKRLEEAEIDAATWRALAGPMWVGDESEGHFVCLACNEPGADDRGTKSIKHRPDCKYAAALAKEEK